MRFMHTAIYHLYTVFAYYITRTYIKYNKFSLNMGGQIILWLIETVARRAADVILYVSM
jgi:hypothetical protein